MTSNQQKRQHSKTICTIESKSYAVKSKWSEWVCESDRDISRKVVNFNAHHRESARASVEDIERSTLQHDARTASQYFCEERIDDVRDSNSQRIQYAEWREDHSSIFVARDWDNVDVLFVIDVVVLAAIKVDRIKEEKYFDVFIIDWFAETTIYIRANAQMFKKKERNWNESEIDDSIVLRDQHRDESSMNAKTRCVSKRREWWRWELKWGWRRSNREWASRSYISCDENDIRSRNYETRRSS